MRFLLLIWSCFLGVFLNVAISPEIQAQPNYFWGSTPSIVADPPAPWVRGQVVRFSIIIDNFDYDQAGTSAYFHGLGIEAGSCWTNFQYGAPPPTVSRDTMNGQTISGGSWVIVRENILPSQCSGWAVPGYYFDGVRTWRVDQEQKIPEDGNPFNNYGEYKSAGSWLFTWQAQVPDAFPMECDLQMKVYVFGDGETGTWKNPPPGCNGGSMPPISAGYVFSDSSAFETPNAIVCQNEAVFFFPKSQPSSIFRSEWLLDGGILLDASSDGSIIATWQNPGIKKVTRILTNQNTKEIYSSSLEVQVLALPKADFIINKTNVCGIDSVLVSFTGYAEEDANTVFDWNFDGGNILNGIGKGPYSISWNTSGTKSIQLTIRQRNCTPVSFEYKINVVEKFTFNFIQRDTGCVRENMLFYDNSPLIPGSIYEWFFEDGEPAHVYGSGAQRVRWRTPGMKNIKAIMRNGACDTTIQSSVYLKPVPEADAGGDLSLCYLFLHQLRADIDTTEIEKYNKNAIIDGKRKIDCSYEWLPIDDIVGRNNQVRVFIRPTQTRTYSLYSYCGECVTLLDQITINIVGESDDIKNNQPEPSVKRICRGDTVKLNPMMTPAQKEKYLIRWRPTAGLDNPELYEPTATPLASTAYYYQFVDRMSGCSDTILQKALIAVEPPIKVDLGPDQILCKIRSTPYELIPAIENLPANPVYIWKPRVGLSCYDCANPIFTDTVTRSYTLTVRDGSNSGRDTVYCVSNSLTDEATVVLRVRPQPIAYAGADITICEGDTVSIGHPPMQGGPPLRYRWSPSVGLSSDTIPMPLVFPTVTTRYALTVISGNCESVADTVLVNVKKAPINTVRVQDHTICLGDSITLTPDNPQVPNARIIEYYWMPATGLNNPRAFSPKASPKENTTYTYFVVADGCTSLTKTTVNVNIHPYPKVYALGIGNDGDTIICSGRLFAPAEVVGGTGGPYRYRWSPSSHVTGVDSLQTLIRTTETRDFILAVTDLSTGCIYRDTIRVIVPPLFLANILPPGRPLKICYGDSLELSVNKQELTPQNPDQPYEFRWFPNETVSCDSCAETTVKPKVTTMYYLEVRHGECVRYDSVLVRVIPQVKAEFFPAQDTICVGQSVAFTNSSTGAGRFVWDFGDGEFSTVRNPQHTYLKEGKYAVRLTVTSQVDPGCIDESPIGQDSIVVLPRPEARFTSFPLPEDTLFLPQNTRVQFKNESKGKKYLWDFGDGIGTSTEKNPTYIYKKAGKYTVTLYVTDETGCVAEEQLGIFLIADAYIIDQVIDNVFSPNNDGFNDVFSIRYVGQDHVSMQIFDRWGNVVFEGVNGWDGKLPSGVNASEGTYFYQIKIGDKFFRGNITLVR